MSMSEAKKKTHNWKDLAMNSGLEPADENPFTPKVLPMSPEWTRCSDAFGQKNAHFPCKAELLEHTCRILLPGCGIRGC